MGKGVAANFICSHTLGVIIIGLTLSFFSGERPAAAAQVKDCSRKFAALWKSDRDRAYEQIPKDICRMQVDGTAYICNTNTCNVDQTQTAKWVQVTKGVAVCSGEGDDAAVKQKMLALYGNPPADGKLPEDCTMLKPGETLMLDEDQTEQDTHIAVKLWRLNCWAQCSPYMSEVYGPSRNLVGPYLRPIPPPK